MALLNRRLTVQPPNLGPYLAWVVVVHVVMLVLSSLVLTNSIKTSKPAMMQVRLVGMPTPTQAPSKQVELEKVRTQDSAAPRDPPPETRNMPPSQAKSKFVTPTQEQPKPDKPNPIQAERRPPVLDKNPNKKKIVKNDLDAKVVKNPEDYMAALDFIKELEAEQLAPKPTAAAQPSTQPAGEGAQIQLDASDMGTVDAIRQHIESNWLRPPGLDTANLKAIVELRLDAEGNVTSQRVLQSSGQAFYDQSLLRAIRKAIPLPIPADSFRKFQVLELHFAR